MTEELQRRVLAIVEREWNIENAGTEVHSVRRLGDGWSWAVYTDEHVVWRVRPASLEDQKTLHEAAP